MILRRSDLNIRDKEYSVAVLLVLTFPVSILIWGLSAIMFEATEQSKVPETLRPPLPASIHNVVSMRVLWTITHYKMGENATWGEEEARNLLFKPLDIGLDNIVFDGRTCPNVVFEKKRFNTKEYMWRVYRTTPETLGIDEKEVEVVKTDCGLKGFGEFIRLRDRRLLVHINGVFFFFEPAVTY